MISTIVIRIIQNQNLIAKKRVKAGRMRIEKTVGSTMENHQHQDQTLITIVKKDQLKKALEGMMVQVHKPNL